jgi:hypothetical protein
LIAAIIGIDIAPAIQKRPAGAIDGPVRERQPIEVIVRRAAAAHLVSQKVAGKRQHVSRHRLSSCILMAERRFNGRIAPWRAYKPAQPGIALRPDG